MCGGNADSSYSNNRGWGLSPRVRGKPARLAAVEVRAGSIPACAGETPGGRLGRWSAAVYPRVCGGNITIRPSNTRTKGLSPRVRGKRNAMLPKHWHIRSIPACAGETGNRRSAAPEPPVYPRVCGGNAPPRAIQRVAEGLSPRVRGKLFDAGGVPLFKGSIPACAGEAGENPAQPGMAGVYPRVCGGSHFPTLRAARQHGLSPRVRGKPSSLCAIGRPARSIPACAGEAGPSGSGFRRRVVYPRVCGGSAKTKMIPGKGQGLSPRVRGKPLLPVPYPQLWRSIPACAGEARWMANGRPFVKVYPRVCGGSP